jgi:hypothetical protein
MKLKHRKEPTAARSQAAADLQEQLDRRTLNSLRRLNSRWRQASTKTNKLSSGGEWHATGVRPEPRDRSTLR